LGSPNFRRVNLRQNLLLKDALQDVHLATDPIVIEIEDSFTHVLDLSDVDLLEETTTEDGGLNLKLGSPLLIRAASNQRPIIALRQPLRFRPANVASPTADAAEQARFDAVMARLNVRLEGVYLARAENFAAGEPLVARAAVNRLELINCTLDPGGFKRFDGSRAPILTSIELHEPYGFSGAEDASFKQTPEIVISRTISGPALIDGAYSLSLADSIIDAGQGVVYVTGINPGVGGDPDTVERVVGRSGIRLHTLHSRNSTLKYCTNRRSQSSSAPAAS
jgi:hypothetical protein